jgi:PAS domain S-box-containing protein
MLHWKNNTLGKLKNANINDLSYYFLNVALGISLVVHILWLIVFITEKDLAVCISTFISFGFQALAFVLNNKGKRQTALLLAVVAVLAYKLSFIAMGKYTIGNEYMLLIIIAIPYLLSDISNRIRLLISVLCIALFFFNYYHIVNHAHPLMYQSGKIDVINSIRFLVAACFFSLWGYFLNVALTKLHKRELLLNEEKMKHELQLEKGKIEEEQKKRFNELIYTLPGGIFQYKMEASGEINLLYISDGCERVWGMTTGEAMSDAKKIFDRIHPEDMQQYRRIIQESNAAKAPVVQTFRILWPCGTVKWVLSNSYPILQEDGSIIRTGNIIDTTEQKEREISLQNSIERSDSELLKLFEICPQPVCLKKPTGELVWVNSLYLKQICCSEDSIENKRIEELDLLSISMTPEEEQRLMEDALKNDNAHVIYENLRLTNKEHVSYVFDVYATSIKPGFSAEELILCFLFDVTKYIENESLKDEVLTQTQFKNKNLEEFSYMVSHNIRSQVANILLLTKRLKACKFEDNFFSYLDYLGHSVNNLDNVIRDMNHILSIKKIGDSKIEDVDLQLLVSDNINEQKLLHSIDDVIVNMNERTDHILYTIRPYIESIMHNLISNSFKYRNTEKQLLIGIELFEANEMMHIHYSDNGLGFDVAKHGDNIFKLYTRLHSAVPGKGMGLYLVKNHVYAMGGSVTVESEVNTGTSFKIAIKKYFPNES